MPASIHRRFGFIGWLFLLGIFIAFAVLWRENAPPSPAWVRENMEGKRIAFVTDKRVGIANQINHSPYNPIAEYDAKSGLFLEHLGEPGTKIIELPKFDSGETTRLSICSILGDDSRLVINRDRIFRGNSRNYVSTSHFEAIAHRAALAPNSMLVYLSGRKIGNRAENNPVDVFIEGAYAGIERKKLPEGELPIFPNPFSSDGKAIVTYDKDGLIRERATDDLSVLRQGPMLKNFLGGAVLSPAGDVLLCQELHSNATIENGALKVTRGSSMLSTTVGSLPRLDLTQTAKLALGGMRLVKLGTKEVGVLLPDVIDARFSADGQQITAFSHDLQNSTYTLETWNLVGQKTSSVAFDPNNFGPVGLGSDSAIVNTRISPGYLAHGARHALQFLNLNSEPVERWTHRYEKWERKGTQWIRTWLLNFSIRDLSIEIPNLGPVGSATPAPAPASTVLGVFKFGPTALTSSSTNTLAVLSPVDNRLYVYCHPFRCNWFDATKPAAAATFVLWLLGRIARRRFRRREIPADSRK